LHHQLTCAQLVKTPLYVQISGMWDGTTVNIPAGDTGGELDPHGAENKGNPVGGNVTTNLATGNDIFYEEWMSFVSVSAPARAVVSRDSGAEQAMAVCQAVIVPRSTAATIWPACLCQQR
jgi:hypothetical protein